MITIGSQLDETGKIRTGIIPYTIYNNRLYFLLGIDKRTREYTDFGGGRSKHETVAQSAWRELQEESCKIFIDLDPGILNDSQTISSKDGKAVIFFMPVNSDFLQSAVNKFCDNQERLKQKKYLELIGIKWIEASFFAKIAYDRKSQCMWKRIQNIIRNNSTWTQLQSKLFNTEVMANPIKRSDSSSLSYSTNVSA